MQKHILFVGIFWLAFSWWRMAFSPARRVTRKKEVLWDWDWVGLDLDAGTIPGCLSNGQIDT